MIFDSLDRLSLYAKDFPALKTADAILKEDLLSKEPGSYTTDDPNCRYNIVHYKTHVGHKDFEIHQREADLQIMLSGGEIMKAATRDLALQAQEPSGTDLFDARNYLRRILFARRILQPDGAQRKIRQAGGIANKRNSK